MLNEQMDSMNEEPGFDPAAVLESMTESILITTVELEAPGPFVVYVNPAFERITGWSRAEILGRSPRVLQGPKTNREIFAGMKGRLLQGKVWSGQTVNYRKDGSEFIMQWSIVPIRNDRGEIFRYVSVQRDVTDRVLIEQNLEKTRAKERRYFQRLKTTNTELYRLIKEQRRTLELFVKYVPEPIVKRALEERSEAILEGELLEVAVLFCDIRNFTGISSKLTPNQVVFLLNTYYSSMAEVIKRHQGTINQFVGDEIFVVFGAPHPVDRCEHRAVYCAAEMVAELDRLNQRVQESIPFQVKVGIGINSGPVIAGNLGSQDRLSYSVTGDTVNFAKRIESLTKNKPNAILVSQSIYAKIKLAVSATPWTPIEIKGKKGRIQVYEITPGGERGGVTIKPSRRTGITE